MKKLLMILCALAAIGSLSAQAPSANKTYWNEHTMLQPFRIPMPAQGVDIQLLDLNNDGKQDAVKSAIHSGKVPILWLDDDGNMKQGDIEGDTVNDCLLVDRDASGEYDLVVKHVDMNSDGKADVQLILDYPVGKENGPKGWNAPHYMWVFDDDGDGVFNYIDWTTITLKCWEKNGISDFYTDYSGNSTFIKAHRVTNSFQDLRINWENPFIFYDYDKDGLSEIALRFCDSRRPHPEAAELGFHHTQYDGGMTWFSIGIDMDNDNCPGNDFDFDMTLHYKAPNAVTYLEYVHPLKNMRGLPEADKFFPDARIRQLTELIYPDRNEAFDLAWRGKWEEARFCYDEDDDCGRWERVELYEDRDAFIQGTKKGGVDNHTQADPAGDRGEWDTDFSGGGDIYVAPWDGRIHLLGAERGVWRIDQNTNYYQGYDRAFQRSAPEKFATIEALDTDNNGFFDTFNYDLNGDKEYETTVSLAALGIDDKAGCKTYDVSKMKYKDYTRLFEKVRKDMWKQAALAQKVAKKYHLTTFWYAKMLTPKSPREEYHYGWWLQFYIYKDLEHSFTLQGNTQELELLHKAYYSGNWKLML